MGMEFDSNVLTPDEYYKRESELFAQGDMEALTKFQRTHSILYADPMPLEDIEQLKEMHLPEVPDSENEMPFEDLFDLK